MVHYYFSFEKMKEEMEEYIKLFPTIKDLFLGIWLAFDGQEVCFPYWEKGRIGYFKKEMEEKIEDKIFVLKHWCIEKIV